MAERLKSGLQIEEAAGADLAQSGCPCSRAEVEQLGCKVILLVAAREWRRRTGGAPMQAPCVAAQGSSRGSGPALCRKGSAVQRARSRWTFGQQTTAARDNDGGYVGIEFEVI